MNFKQETQVKTSFSVLIIKKVSKLKSCIDLVELLV